MKSSKGTWRVAPDDASIRLDQFLVKKMPEESRSQIQNWIRKGHLKVNGRDVKTGYRTRAGDSIEVEVPDAAGDLPTAENIHLDILYEDSDLAVINKPAGLVCHAGAGVRTGTLVNALLFHMGPLDTGDPSRPGIVHRLDKNTSGVMVVAKTTAIHRKLGQQFKSRSVQKEYLALVYGSMPSDEGTLDKPLGRDPVDRKKISTRARRSRPAVTHYSLEKRYGPFSLLRIRLETGRTHQIRVHLADMGHPVVGDVLYGGRKYLDLPNRLQSAVTVLQRPFLHSHRLGFHHPGTGRRMSVGAELPEELQRFLALISEHDV